VFDLAAAIGARRRGTALAILARNLEAGEAPLRILGSLAWQYRRLWKVKDLLKQAGREGEVARQLRMDPSRLNVNGGSIALGHPIGASGARIVVTLLHEMRRRQTRYGLVSMCVGGGMGAAGIFERL